MIQAEDSDRLAARRELFGEKMVAMDPSFFPLVLAAFMGPETAPDELVNESILEEIRAV
jgi:hypothetical protein